jgi:hypothetical protein
MSLCCARLYVADNTPVKLFLGPPPPAAIRLDRGTSEVSASLSFPCISFLSGDPTRTRRYLPSQIYSLRVLSTLRLTAAKPALAAFHVREGKDGGKCFWTRIGAALNKRKAEYLIAVSEESKCVVLSTFSQFNDVTY